MEARQRKMIYKSKQLLKELKTLRFWRRIGKQLDNYKKQDIPTMVEPLGEKMKLEVVQMKYFDEGK